MTALRAKYIRDLTVRGRAQRTQRAFTRSSLNSRAICCLTDRGEIMAAYMCHSKDEGFVFRTPGKCPHGGWPCEPRAAPCSKDRRARRAIGVPSPDSTLPDRKPETLSSRSAL